RHLTGGTRDGSLVDDGFIRGKRDDRRSGRRSNRLFFMKQRWLRTLGQNWRESTILPDVRWNDQACGLVIRHGVEPPLRERRRDFSRGRFECRKVHHTSIE